MDDLDEQQVASWMKQAAANPFVGGEETPNSRNGLTFFQV